MKKFLKVLLIIVIAIVLLIMVVKLFHEISSVIDERNMKGAYGTAVCLDDGRNLNIVNYGSGESVIVILPGLGSISPGLEYKGIANALEGYEVVVVEPLGYGLSDMAKTDRSNENICEEIHEALNKAGYYKYTLLAHSVSGEYALTYIASYPDEIERFIGLDTSVPAQIKDEESTDAEISAYTANGLMSKFGVLRMLCALSSDEEIIIPEILKELTPEEIKVYRTIARTKTCNSTILNEVKNIKSNFGENLNYKFPEELEVNLYLSKESCDNTKDWQEMHEEMMPDNGKNTLEVLEGGHYLHLDCKEEIVKALQKRDR